MELSWWVKACLYHHLGGGRQESYLSTYYPDQKFCLEAKSCKKFCLGALLSCPCIYVPMSDGEYFVKSLIMIRSFQGKSSIFHRHPLYNTEMYHKLQYDFSSIMHCPRDHFSKRRHLYTVQALHNPNRVLGGDELSELDIRKLEMMFCKGKCIPFEEHFLSKYRILNCEKVGS